MWQCSGLHVRPQLVSSSSGALERPDGSHGRSGRGTRERFAGGPPAVPRFFPLQMPKNSCRKNNHPVSIYSFPCLGADNWTEKEMEPAMQQTRIMKAYQLPGPGTHTFSNLTTQAYGEWKKDQMRKSLNRTASDHWIHVSRPGTEFYKSNAEVEFCHPSEQQAKFRTPHIPEDGGGIRVREGSIRWAPFHLGNYRETWTTGKVGSQFAKQKAWPTFGGFYET